MKLIWMNDQNKNQTIRILDRSFDPVEFKGDKYIGMEPQEVRTFDLNLKEGDTLFIKQWDNLTMISYTNSPEVFK